MEGCGRGLMFASVYYSLSERKHHSPKAPLRRSLATFGPPPHFDVHGSSAGSEESEHLGERRQGGLAWQAAAILRDLSSLFEHVDLAQTP